MKGQFLSSVITTISIYQKYLKSCFTAINYDSNGMCIIILRYKSNKQLDVNTVLYTNYLLFSPKVLNDCKFIRLN